MGILTQQRLWIVTGKGGVGKSTVAAALAVASARTGRRTLVCEVNANERVTALLGHPPVGPELRQIEPNLWAVNVQPEPAMREYGVMVLKFQTVYKAVFENRFVKYFLRFIPSLQELVMIGKIIWHLREKNSDGSPKWDRIVMDAPATGHAISFLSIPQVLLDTIPPGPMSREAEVMRDLLEDESTTAVVLVSLPEEMPLVETIELNRTLREEVRVTPAAAVLNMHIPHRFTGQDLSETTPGVRELARRHQIREDMSQEAIDRLERELGLPIITVPRIFEARLARPAVEKVVEHLAPLWEDA